MKGSFVFWFSFPLFLPPLPSTLFSTLFHYGLQSFFSFPFSQSLGSDKEKQNDPVLGVGKMGIKFWSYIKFTLKIAWAFLCFSLWRVFIPKYLAWYRSILYNKFKHPDYMTSVWFKHLSLTTAESICKYFIVSRYILVPNCHFLL